MLKPPAILKAEANEEHRLTLAAARSLARRCASELAAESVLLFGSRARADWRRGSECDVLVVSETFRGMPFAERWTAIHDRWDPVVDLNRSVSLPLSSKRGNVGAALSRWRSPTA